MITDCEHINGSGEPANLRQAARQFGDFMQKVRKLASEGVGVEEGGGEVVATIHYDKEHQRVTITYPDQEESPPIATNVTS
jgi:hypothetical protein